MIKSDTKKLDLSLVSQDVKILLNLSQTYVELFRLADYDCLSSEDSKSVLDKFYAFASSLDYFVSSCIKNLPDSYNYLKTKENGN